MKADEMMGRIGRSDFALTSVDHAAARVRVLYERQGVQVVLVELAPGAALREPSLWGTPTWHLVLAGEAVVRQGRQRWELLPQESLSLPTCEPYLLSNRAPEAARVMTLRLGDAGEEAAERSSTMSVTRKVVAWGMAIVAWVNVLSIGLSWWQFGLVDWATVAGMAAITVPPLLAGAYVLWRLGRAERFERALEEALRGPVPVEPSRKAVVGAGVEE